VRRILRALVTRSREVLSDAGAPSVMPAGAFYLFPDFAGSAQGRRHPHSAALAAAALEETGVAFLPGSDFGRPPEEATVRLSLVDFDGGAALGALTADPVDALFLERWCVKVLEAVRRLSAWAGG
jgi:aspartate aminotransferase